MSRKIHVVHVPLNGDVQLKAIRPSYKEIQKLLDAVYFEEIHGIYTEQEPFIDWAGYCDERRMVARQDVNPIATMAAIRIGWSGTGERVLCGPVVFFGPLKSGGWEQDIPEPLIDVLREHEVL